jgi:hypothetical protein
MILNRMILIEVSAIDAALLEPASDRWAALPRKELQPHI